MLAVLTGEIKNPSLAAPFLVYTAVACGFGPLLLFPVLPPTSSCRVVMAAKPAAMTFAPFATLKTWPRRPALP